MSKNPPKDFGLGQKMPNGLIIENILNKEDDTLPYGFYNPETEGKLTWVCNYGIEGNEIISVYNMKVDGGDGHRDVKYLASLEEAKYVRDELIANGWLPLKLPDIKFTFSGESKK